MYRLDESWEVGETFGERDSKVIGEQDRVDPFRHSGEEFPPLEDYIFIDPLTELEITRARRPQEFDGFEKRGVGDLIPPRRERPQLGLGAPGVFDAGVPAEQDELRPVSDDHALGKPGHAQPAAPAGVASRPPRMTESPAAASADSADSPRSQANTADVPHSKRVTQKAAARPWVS